MLLILTAGLFSECFTSGVCFKISLSITRIDISYEWDVFSFSLWFFYYFFEWENDLLDVGPRIFFHSESEQEQTVFRGMTNFSSPPQWEKQGGFSHWCRSGIASNAPRRADDVCLLSFQPTPSALVTKCDFNVWHFHRKRSEITCCRL